ncbi:MAG: GNAT family N-acetyltransferase [Ornithinimicrobium sp.]
MTEPHVSTPAHLRWSRFADLDVDTLYALLRLRSDVFVVEQRCPYPELDGRDTEPQTEHLWAEVDREVVAVVRILRGPQAWHIGRVATAPGHRGRGYAAELVRFAIERIGAQPIDIGAQAHLQGWYERFGFVRSGPDYVEDGIPHLSMRRDPG